MQYHIDKNLPLPLYYQLKQIIMNSIDEGIYQEGTAIPTEFELISKYDVSRTTVRQALNELVNEGYLYRKKGIGTFVSPQSKIDEKSDAFNTSIYKIDRVINRNGFICKTEFLDAGVVPAPHDVATYLEIEVGQEVWFMDRIRYADNKPASFSRSYFNKSLIDNFVEDAHTASQHFYQYLESKGYKISIIREKLKPGLPDKDIKKALSLDGKNPIMLIEDIGYLDNGKPIEFSISVLDVSFVDFSATFKR